MNPDELPAWLAIPLALALWGYLAADAIARRHRAHRSNEQEQER